MAPTVQTRTSARRMLAAAHKAGLIPHGPTFPHFRYRRAGQRGSSSVVVFDAGRHADAKAALERLLGPVSYFEPAKPRFPARLTLAGRGALPSPVAAARPVVAAAQGGRSPLPIRSQAPPIRHEPPPRVRAPALAPETPAGKIEALAREVWRLSVSHRDPEAFHIAKSSIAADLRTLARTIGNSA